MLKPRLSRIGLLASVLAGTFALTTVADISAYARGFHGGGGGMRGGGTRGGGSYGGGTRGAGNNRGGYANRNASWNGNGNLNRNGNWNRNANWNGNGNWNGGRYGYGYGGYGGWGYGAGRAAAWGLAAGATAAAIGSTVYSLPSGCASYNGYYNCGGSWYQPSGTGYVVVNPPDQYDQSQYPPDQPQ